jgi:hypothetical protein
MQGKFFHVDKPVLLEQELHEVIERGKLIKSTYERETESDEDKYRIEFAILAH